MRPKYRSARLSKAGVTHLCALLSLSFLLTAGFAAAQEAIDDESADGDSGLESSDGELASDVSDDSFEGDAEMSAEAGAEGDSYEEGGGLFESSLDSGSELGGEESSGGLSLDLGGYVRGDTFVGVIPGSTPTEPAIQAAYGEFALQATARAGEYGSAFAEMRLRYGQQLDEQGLFVDLREAYVDTYVGPFDIRFGKQIVVWGRADAFNPTNNVTPTNFRIRSPHADDKRVGNVGARVYANFLPFRLEGIWMPLYEPTVLPTIQLESPDIVRFSDPNYPSVSVRDGTYAIKAHAILSAFEGSVSYLYGNAPLPGYDLGYVQGGDGVRANTQVNIVPTSYNQHVVGADFSTTLGSVGLRGEAAYRHPIDYQTRMYAPNPDLQYVLGVDKELGPIKVIAQYMGRYTFDWVKKNAPPPGNDIDQLVDQGNPISGTAAQALNALLGNRNQILFGQLAEVQHMATVRLEWLTLHDTLSLSAVGMMNFTTSEWLLQPQISYKITGNLSTTLGGEIYAGPDETLFGWIDDSLSSGYVELKLDF